MDWYKYFLDYQPLIIIKQSSIWGHIKIIWNTLDTILFEKASNAFIGLVLVYASELLLPSETIFSGCKHPSLVVLWCQSYVIYIGYFYLSQFHEYQYLNIYFGLCMCMMEMTIRYLNGVMSSLKSFIRHYWKTHKINVSIIYIICLKRSPPRHLYNQGKLF